jgi:DNA-binding GntR family transcriptional regulator
MVTLLRAQIESGELPRGKLLPPVHSLAVRYDVSDGTVKRALGVLRGEDLVATARGKGIYVR